MFWLFGVLSVSGFGHETKNDTERFINLLFGLGPALVAYGIAHKINTTQTDLRHYALYAALFVFLACVVTVCPRCEADLLQLLGIALASDRLVIPTADAPLHCCV